ncbi:PIN domain-containing protein [Brachyspira pilosicoli]|uniref:hypothetical protein n=1 Tax=Brachyspira pilosicoli TaxID=52584 RepID=UPI003005BAFD
MIIFLDTNILFSNKQNLFLDDLFHLKSLLFLSEYDLIKIYISDIVILELHKHYLDFMKKNLDNIKENINKLKKNLEKSIIDKIEFDSYISKLEKCIDEKNIEDIDSKWEDKINNFKNKYNIMTIENRNVDFNFMLKRYLESKAPFHKNSGSWKDFLIWNSYANIINSIPNDEYIVFISENTEDFADTQKQQLHEDFLYDINNKNIIYYNDINKLTKEDKTFISLKEKYENINEKLKDIKEYIINNDFISVELINKYFMDEIEIKTEEINLLESEIFLDKYEYLEEYILGDITDTDINYVDIDIDIKNGFLEIHGELSLIRIVYLYSTNFLRESSNDDWYEEDEEYINFVVSFSFLINGKNIVDNEDNIDDSIIDNIIEAKISDLCISGIC